MRDRYAVPHILSRTDRGRLLRPRLRACPGPALADDAAAPHRAGPAQRDLRAGDGGDRHADARARPLRAGARRRWTCRPTRPRRRWRPMPTGSTPGCGWCRRRRSAAARRSSSCSPRTIAPWIPADSIAVQKLMALQLTDKAAMETLRARAVAAAAAGAAARHPARLAERAGDGAAGVLAALPGRRRRGRWSRRRGTRSTRCAPPGLAGASNAFAAMGGRAAGGAPLLATDPHLGLTRAVDLDAGAHGPGRGAGDGRRPSPASRRSSIGRNADLGWGLTSSYLDDQDVYIERLNPDDPDAVPDPAGLPRLRDPRGGDRRARRRAGAPSRCAGRRHGPVIPGDNFGAGGDHPARPRGGARLDGADRRRTARSARRSS